MTTLPQTLEAGDGLTFDRDLALVFTRHKVNSNHRADSQSRPQGG